MNRMTYPPVNDALRGLIQGFSLAGQSQEQKADAELLESLLQTFSDAQTLEKKLNQLDQLFDDHPQYDDIREMCTDLLVLNEWVSGEGENEEDEDILEERGTELLHMLTYLDECRELGQAPGIKDFLSLYDDEPDSEDMDYFRLLFECSEAIAHGPDALSEALKDRNLNQHSPEIIPIAFFLTGISDTDRLIRAMKPYTEEVRFQIPFLCAMMAFWNGNLSNQANRKTDKA